MLLLGNFDLQEATPAQLAMLKTLLARLRQACGLPASAIFTHHEIRTRAGLAGTSCPGKNLQRRMAELR